MKQTTIYASASIPLVAGTLLYATSINQLDHSVYVLTDHALVIVPVDNQQYLENATQLYLEPSGFDGTADDVAALNLPEYIPGKTPSQIIDIGIQQLVDTVKEQSDAHDLSASDPLYIFGYSQGAVIAALAEQQLKDYGITPDELHFVLAGDSASSEGGFLNTFIDSLPEWLRQPATDMFTLFGLGNVLGATTPDDLYTTDVYGLSSDGWVNWDDGANLFGMFSDHLAYLGLTPDEIASATDNTVGDTTYHLIDRAGVDMFSALINTLEMAVSVF